MPLSRIQPDRYRALLDEKSAAYDLMLRMQQQGLAYDFSNLDSTQLVLKQTTGNSSVIRPTSHSDHCPRECDKTKNRVLLVQLEFPKELRTNL